MKKNKVKEKKHRLLNRPVLSMFLFYVLFLIIESVLQVLYLVFARQSENGPGDPGELMSDPFVLLGTIFSALLIFLFFARRFRKEYRWKKKAGWLKESCKMIWPVLPLAVMNLLECERFIGPEMIPLALLSGITPAISEEITFRGVNIPNWMRVKAGNPKAIPAIVLITALFFGLAHALNIVVGADLGLTVLQVIYAFGLGVIFAAVAIRTGSVTIPILAHALIDITAFLNAEVYEAGGVLTTEEFVIDWSVILVAAAGILFAVLGFLYIRPSKRAKIMELWAEKWPVPAEEVPESEASSEETEEAPGRLPEMNTEEITENTPENGDTLSGTEEKTDGE